MLADASDRSPCLRIRGFSMFFFTEDGTQTSKPPGAGVGTRTILPRLLASPYIEGQLPHIAELSRTAPAPRINVVDPLTRR